MSIRNFNVNEEDILGGIRSTFDSLSLFLTAISVGTSPFK